MGERGARPPAASGAAAGAPDASYMPWIMSSGIVGVPAFFLNTSQHRMPVENLVLCPSFFRHRRTGPRGGMFTIRSLSDITTFEHGRLRVTVTSFIGQVARWPAIGNSTC